VANYRCETSTWERPLRRRTASCLVVPRVSGAKGSICPGWSAQYRLRPHGSYADQRFPSVRRNAEATNDEG
jgi:hypothetical protein